MRPQSQSALPVSAVVRQAQVNFIDDGDAATRLHELVDVAQGIGVDGCAGGVGRAGQQHTLGLRAPRLPNLIGIELIPLVSGGGQHHGAPTSSLDKLAVARVAGVGQQDFVAIVHQGHAGQVQCCRCTGGDHDAAWVNGQPPALGIPLADALAQSLQAQGVGVLGLPILDGLMGCRLHQGWGREVGLSDVERDHGAVGVCELLRQPRRGLSHFHHIKRLNALGALRQFHA